MLPRVCVTYTKPVFARSPDLVWMQLFFTPHRTEHTSREFLSTAIWTMPSLSLHFSKMASWMARSQFSPTSLKHKYKKVATRKSNRGKKLHLVEGTHMTGSNMFLIFRHGVRLFGGEFLRSRGKAKEEGKNVNDPPSLKEIQICKNIFVGATFSLPDFGRHWGGFVTTERRLDPPPHEEVCSANPLILRPNPGLVGREEAHSLLPNLVHFLSENISQLLTYVLQMTDQ